MTDSHAVDSVYSFHGGPPLNVWERCSLQSFADHGHDIVLFSYDRLDVPRGVRLESAADIISLEERDKFFALAPGAYVVSARHAGRFYRREFNVKSGEVANVEVVMP